MVAKITIKILSAIFFIFLIASCGKYGNPLPPEAFAPQAIEKLSVKADTAGVYFSWQASRYDLRGKELESADGFQLVRKEISKDSDIIDDRVDFEDLNFVKDRHVAERDKLREEARLAGKPAKRVNVGSEFLQFETQDTSVKAGREYVYKIVPVNQNGVEGDTSQLIRVMFNGQNSKLQLISISDLKLEADT